MQWEKSGNEQIPFSFICGHVWPIDYFKSELILVWIFCHVYI